MLAIVVRGANGLVVWTRTRANAQVTWRCSRDGFTVAAATTPQNAEATLVALAQHSGGLVGNILQVIQLEV